MKPLGLALVVMAIALLHSCSTINTRIMPGADGGGLFGSDENERIYATSYDKTFRACVDTLRRMDSGSAKLIRFNEGVIVFQQPDEGKIEVHVRKLDEEKTIVYFSAKKERKFWFDGADEQTRNLFFQGLDEQLAPSALTAVAAPQPEISKSMLAEEVKPKPEAPKPESPPLETAQPVPEPPAENLYKNLLLAQVHQALQIQGNMDSLEDLPVEDLARLSERLQSLRKSETSISTMSGKCTACYIDLARVYHDVGQYARAAEALKAALAVEPDNAVAHCNLGEIYKHLNLIDDAIRELNAAEALNPQLPDTFINLGIIYDDYVNDDRKALQCYRRYLSLGGSDPQVLDWIKIIEAGLAKEGT